MKSLKYMLLQQQVVVLLLLALVLFLSGCSMTPKVKEVAITTTAIEKLPLKEEAPCPRQSGTIQRKLFFTGTCALSVFHLFFFLNVW